MKKLRVHGSLQYLYDLPDQLLIYHVWGPEYNPQNLLSDDPQVLAKLRTYCGLTLNEINTRQENITHADEVIKNEFRLSSLCSYCIDNSSQLQLWLLENTEI